MIMAERVGHFAKHSYMGQVMRHARAALHCTERKVSGLQIHETKEDEVCVSAELRIQLFLAGLGRRAT